MAAPDAANLIIHMAHQVGIANVGSGVDTWADQSGNGHDLIQNTDDTFRPIASANGVTFDGDNDRLVAVDFPLTQPNTIYIRMTMDGWNNLDGIFDGYINNRGKLTQEGTTPDLFLFAGAFGPINAGLPIGTEAIVTVIFNGVNSSIAIDDGTPVTGDAGANDLDGFCLGCNGAQSTFAQITVKDVLVYNGAHPAPTQTSVRLYIEPPGVEPAIGDAWAPDTWINATWADGVWAPGAGGGGDDEVVHSLTDKGGLSAPGGLSGDGGGLSG